MTGGFLQPDSMMPDPGNPQALNRYSYVLNNPLRYIDPTGRQGMPPDAVCAGECPQEWVDELEARAARYWNWYIWSLAIMAYLESQAAPTPTPTETPMGTPPVEYAPSADYCPSSNPFLVCPTPVVTPGPTPVPYGWGDFLEDAKTAASAAKAGVHQAACNSGTLVGLEICVATSPELQAAVEWYWDQHQRNTCAGDITRGAGGAAITVVGFVGVFTGNEEFAPLVPFGLAIVFGGPPGALPFENCY